MEMSPHCTVSPPHSRFRLLPLLPLTFGVLLVHGYHPWAEDGGLYVAGIEHLLNPALFPKDTAFVTEHLRYSVFAPLLAAAVRFTHLSLAAVLFSTYLLSIALMLFAALRLAERCIATRAGQWIAVALLAAWWTLPVAGTSLLLMDPYVTARSLSTPLSLLAVGAALDSWPWSWFRSEPKTTINVQRQSRSPQQEGSVPSALLCILALTGAALFHPLMAGYAVGLVLFLRLERSQSPARLYVLLTAVVLVGAGTLQAISRPDSAPSAAAAYSRYYWFLSQWQWYEWLGLLGPVLIFATFLLWKPASLNDIVITVCRAALRLAALSVLVAVCLSHEHFGSHVVASLQPLRAFLLLYTVMILLLGGALAACASRPAPQARQLWLVRVLAAVPILFVGAMAITMYGVQRAAFPASIHGEIPGRVNPNDWVQAFLWARAHTRQDALFALDARYVNTEGEDAQTFRAIAERSAIPDFSKDGGEAAIAPALAPTWLHASAATRHLSELRDPERDALLQPFGVQWMVLHASAATAHPCPYRNPTVKVCILL